MKNNALSIANSILLFAEREKRPLKHLALMKLVYFAYGHALAYMFRNVIDPRFDRVEAWKYGPVIPSVYHSFKYFQDAPITEKAVVMEVDANNIPFYTTPFVTDDKLLVVIKNVWDQFKGYPDSRLVALSHEADTPWAKIYVEGENREIPESATQLYYMQKLGLCNKVKQQMIARITELTNLQQTAGVSPLNSEIAHIVYKIVELADDKALSLWIPFPDTNGALSMDLKTDTGMTGNISIGLDGYSCFVQGKDRFDMREESLVSIKDILDFMNKVSTMV